MTLYQQFTMNTLYSKTFGSAKSQPKLHRFDGSRRFYVKAQSKDEYENYQVFQHKHMVFDQSTDVHEVDDHLEAVVRLRKADKDDHFMSHGLDYDRCYEYINVVKYLNKCWGTPNIHHHNHTHKDNKKVLPVPPGWTIICVIAFIYHFVKDDV